MNTKIIILAGGSGQRFGTYKQFISINNKPLFIYTLQNLNNFYKIVTMPKQYIKYVKDIADNYNIKNVVFIEGGETRQESVLKALQKCYEDKKNCKIAITDVNRLFLKESTLRKCLLALNDYNAVITVSKTINTICDVVDGKLKTIYNRQYMYDLLMPQCFYLEELYYAHIKTTKKDVTDDTQLILESNPKATVKVVPISFWEGLKLTYPEDYKVFEKLLESKKCRKL
jgi:2-C-methyl-D-erythritol 4-phosphate cytidylyltransferase